MLWQISNSLENVYFLYKYPNFLKKKNLRSVLNNYDYFKNKKHYFRINKKMLQIKKKKFIKLKYNYILGLNITKKKHKQKYKNKYLSKRINWKTYKLSPIYQKLKLLIKKKKQKKFKKKKLTILKIKKKSFSNIQKRFRILRWTFLNNRRRKKLKVKFRKLRKKIAKIRVRTDKYLFLKKILFKDKYYTWGLKKKILKKYKNNKKKYKINVVNPKLRYLNKKLFKILGKSLISVYIKNFFLKKKKKKFTCLWDKRLNRSLIKLRKKIYFKKKRILKKKFEKKFGKNSGKEFERRFAKKFNYKFKQRFGKGSKKLLKKRVKKLKKFLKIYLKLLLKKKLKKLLKKKKKINLKKLKSNLYTIIVKKNSVKSTVRLNSGKKKKYVKKRYKTPLHKRFFKHVQIKKKKIKPKRIKKRMKIYKKILKIRRKYSSRRHRHLIFYYLKLKNKTLKYLQKHHFTMSRLYKNKYKKYYKKRKPLFRDYYRRFFKKKKKIFQKSRRTRFIKKAIKRIGKNKFYRMFLWKQINFNGKRKFRRYYKKLLKKKRKIIKTKQKSPRFSSRLLIFRKIKLKKKRVFFYFLSKRIPKIIKKKRKKKNIKITKIIKIMKKLVQIKSKLKFIKTRCGNSKNTMYLYTLKHNNLILNNTDNKYNINNFLWLNNKLFESYLLKFFFNKSKLISKINKKKKKKTFFFNFRNKKLKTYRNARSTHWKFFTCKTLKERRYQNFLNIFLKKQKSFFFKIFTFFTFKFKLSYKFWTNFNFLYKIFYLVNNLKRQIYQIPIHKDFWYFIKRYDLDKKKVTTKVKFWQSKKFKIRKTFWMQQKKRIPKYLKKKIFDVTGIVNCIQYDFITNYFVILKQHRQTTHTDLFIFKNKYLKLHGFKYNS